MTKKIPNRRRVEPRARKAEIVLAAIELARRHGYTGITRELIAERAGCSVRLINYYFTTIAELRGIVMAEAVKQVIVEIIAQGLALRDPQAIDVPQPVKMRAVAYIMGSGA